MCLDRRIRGPPVGARAYREGMARVVSIALAVGVTAAGLGIQPATAATTRDLYMVKNVQFADGIYIGEFAAVRKKGKKVVGAVGAFYSEYFCIRGTVKNGRLRAVYYDEFNQPAGLFKRRWTGKGSKQRIKGMTSVSRKKLKTYAGGTDPKRLIRNCVRNT